MKYQKQKYHKPRLTGFYLLLITTILCYQAKAQTDYDSIKTDYIEKTIKYLSSDKLKGRVNFSTGQLEAAEFLSGEFKEAGLQPFPGLNSYYMPFRMAAGHSKWKLEWNDSKIDDSSFIFISSEPKRRSASLKDFIIIKADYPLADSLIYNYWNSAEKTLLWINLTSIADFKSITSKLIHPAGMPMSDILIVGSSSAPVAMNLKIKEDDVPHDLFNIVGIIPGDSLPHEAVVFSAHYDHVDEDYSDPSKKGQVFNGANDNASGTTAVLALAKYFAELKDNRRTLVFCLFAAEEIGLLGSEAFVRMINIKNIKANINIEMIGNTNAAGPNAFMVTGYDKSTLYNILNKNMKGDRFQVKPLVNDPKMLFERSDNYSFARYNIPAHSIMCSDDSDPCYHKPCDDFKFIRVENMTKVIRAIAKSSSTIISGEDTPVWKNK